MTGIILQRLLIAIICTATKNEALSFISHARAQQVIRKQNGQYTLVQMHKDVETHVLVLSRSARDEKNRDTNLIQPNLQVGELVLVRQQDKWSYKQRFKWVGPRRMIALLEH